MRIGKFKIELHSVANYVNDMVLLQVGIERKTRDASYIYMVITSNCLKTSEVFTSTSVVANSLRLFAMKEDHMAMGSNKNKLFRVEKTEEQKKQDKKDKFAGAFVLNPAHCTSTGFELLGQENSKIHEHGIDMDITSESEGIYGGSLEMALNFENCYV